MREVFEGVSATALLVNESRARRPALSRDPFASAWIPADARADVVDLWEDFARAVYGHDDLVSSVRGRAVLAAVRTAARWPGPLHLVSVAAGFTSYPFLADVHRTVELDLPHVAAAKRRRTAELVDAGVLPPRDVQHLGVDLATDAGVQSVASALDDVPVGAAVVLVVEGVLYYLAEHRCRELLGLVAERRTGLAAAAVSFWPTSAAANPVLARQAAWFVATGVDPQATHLEPRDVAEALGAHSEHLDTAALQRAAGLPTPIDEVDLVPEHLVRSNR